MTGNDIYLTVTTLLGFSEALSDIHNDIALRERMLVTLNRIGADLCDMPPVKSLNDGINLSSAFCEALIYGVAMLISLTDGDSEKNSIFTSLYNSKRAAAKAQKATVNDTLPKAVF